MNRELPRVLMVDNDSDYMSTAGELIECKGYVFYGFSNYQILIAELDQLLIGGLNFGIIDGDQGLKPGTVLDGQTNIEIIKEHSGILSVKCPVLIGNSADRVVPGADYQNFGSGTDALISLMKSIHTR